jgi:hypothetical protein
MRLFRDDQPMVKDWIEQYSNQISVFREKDGCLLVSFRDLSVLCLPIGEEVWFSGSLVQFGEYLSDYQRVRKLVDEMLSEELAARGLSSSFQQQES